MADLRDSIKSNWMTTGQELTKDFRQFWQTSRPASPARTPTQEKTQQELAASATSPSALSRLSHLDIPSRGQERGSSEFAAGYSLGLIGGVRSWVIRASPCMYHTLTDANAAQMARSQRNLNDSRPQSPTSDEDSGEQSERSPRGRTGKQTASDNLDART